MSKYVLRFFILLQAYWVIFLTKDLLFQFIVRLPDCEKRSWVGRYGDCLGPTVMVLNDIGVMIITYIITSILIFLFNNLKDNKLDRNNIFSRIRRINLGIFISVTVPTVIYILTH